MTLILACLTARTVYQVSDRRLTLLSKPNSVVDDDRNKAVFVDRVSFGYTGLAQIGHERTDDWLARVISEGPTRDMDQVGERIRSAASAAFRKLPATLPKKFKHHAFQGVGWFRLRGQRWLSPGIMVIHNGLDEQTGEWLVEPFEKFRVATQFPSALPRTDCILNSVGVRPGVLERSAVVRLVRKCVKHRSSTPATVLKAMIVSMRWLSGRHPRVGKTLLAVSLPKRSVEEWERTGRTLLLAAIPNDSTATFTYISSQGSLISHGPHVVGEGIVLTGIQGGPLK
jgi:hypothetical protein